MPNIEARTRAQMAKFLPSAINKATITYRTLTHMNLNEKDAAEYKKHQEACKVAVAHIHLLVKLARDVAALETSEPEKAEDDNAMLQTLIENAQKELKEV